MKKSNELIDDLPQLVKEIKDSRFYRNGNYVVVTDDYSRTKIALKFNEPLRAEFPDSIDLKITDKCSYGCKFCHENSTPNGKHFDIERTKETLKDLPAGVELAIGGGSVLEVGVDVLYEFFTWANLKGFLTRITVMAKDLKTEEFKSFIEKAKKFQDEEQYQNKKIDYSLHDAFAVGVSVHSLDDVYLLEVARDTYRDLRFVAHVIAGVTPMDVVAAVMYVQDEAKYKLSKKLLDFRTKHWKLRLSDSGWRWAVPEYGEDGSIELGVLVLGFKTFGRASRMKVPDLTEFRRFLIENYFQPYRYSKLTLGFDNLAIEQLDVAELTPKYGRNNREFYLGDEFSCSMYVDAVEQTFGSTSRSDKSERVSWNDMSLIDYFKSNKNEHGSID